MLDLLPCVSLYEDHECTASQGLKLLAQLLFGERPGGFTSDGVLPPEGAGLQLSGNREMYYNPDNSFLHRCSCCHSTVQSELCLSGLFWVASSRWSVDH